MPPTPQYTFSPHCWAGNSQAGPEASSTKPPAPGQAGELTTTCHQRAARRVHTAPSGLGVNMLRWSCRWSLRLEVNRRGSKGPEVETRARPGPARHQGTAPASCHRQGRGPGEVPSRPAPEQGPPAPREGLRCGPPNQKPERGRRDLGSQAPAGISNVSG